MKGSIGNEKIRRLLIINKLIDDVDNKNDK